MLDPVTNLLFSDSYPREVGKKRNLVTSQPQFEDKIDMLNGVDEVFTNANPLDGSINKIFMDFDGPNSLQEAQKVYTYTLSNNIPTIPVASGKKGIHLYCLFKPRKGDDNKETLIKATDSLLVKSFNLDPNSPTTIKSFDNHVKGDLRRLCRVTQTLRPPENSSFCTFLPPNKGFLEMKDKDLWWYIRGTHEYNLQDYGLDKKSLPKFDEVIIPEIEKTKITFECQTTPSLTTYIDNDFLRPLIRPCLYRLITVQEPRHSVRVATTAELLAADMNPADILKIYQSLKWVDFSAEYTMYQIERCKPLHYSKNRLKQLGICFNCGKSCF